MQPTTKALLTIFLTAIFALQGQDRDNSYRVDALSMRDCLLRALKFNLDLEIEGYNPEIRKFDKTIAKSAFDPIWTTSFIYSDRKQQQTSVFSANSIIQAQVDTELKKRHILGGAVALKYSLSYTDQQGNEAFVGSNPIWQHDISLELSQPLLRNFGIDVNLTEVRIARKNIASSKYAYKNKVLAVIADVQKAYWALVNARDAYELQRKSLELIVNQYNITRERIKVGSLAAAEILDAERNVALRQDDLVVAEQNVYAAEDALKQLIRPLDLSYYKDVRLIPTERPSFEKMQVDFDKTLQYALRNRPDVLQSKLAIETATLSIEYNKNQLLPRVDISGSFGYSGVGETGSEAWITVREVDLPAWQTGIVVEIPLGNRTAYNRYRKSLAERKQLGAQHRKLLSAIVAEIRQAIRDLTTAIRRVETASKTRELAEKQLVNEENKFRAGLIALFQVQNTEQNLTEARIREVNALVSYQTAIVSLYKAKGALAENMFHYNIDLQLPSLGK